MATLPRRDLDDLASLVGEAERARPDAGREAAVTDALRSLPQEVHPDPGFAERLRAKLIRQAEESGQEESVPATVPTSVRPE